MWPDFTEPLWSVARSVRKRVKLHGSVTRVEWINPHAWIHIAVKTGATEEWRVEAAPPGPLLRRGLTKESLSVGTEITVDAYLSKNGLPVAHGLVLSLPGGKTIHISSNTGDGKRVIFGSTPTLQRK